jgi:hypothetical protein
MAVCLRRPEGRISCALSCYPVATTRKGRFGEVAVPANCFELILLILVDSDTLRLEAAQEGGNGLPIQVDSLLLCYLDRDCAVEAHRADLVQQV